MMHRPEACSFHHSDDPNDQDQQSRIELKKNKVPKSPSNNRTVGEVRVQYPSGKYTHFLDDIFRLEFGTNLHIEQSGEEERLTELGDELLDLVGLNGDESLIVSMLTVGLLEDAAWHPSSLSLLDGYETTGFFSTNRLCLCGSTPHIPEVKIPEDVVVNIARSLTFEANRGFVLLREVALGKDLKKFVGVIAGLWVLSIVGSWCNFLTLFYLAFVSMHTVPVLYEKYENQVDAFGEKALVEFKKQYAVIDAKVLSKIPKGPLKDKKF